MRRRAPANVTGTGLDLAHSRLETIAADTIAATGPTSANPLLRINRTIAMNAPIHSSAKANTGQLARYTSAAGAANCRRTPRQRV